jgi:hypothetical protein
MRDPLDGRARIARTSARYAAVLAARWDAAEDRDRVRALLAPHQLEAHGMRTLALPVAFQITHGGYAHA